MSQKVRKYLISLLSMVNVSILIPKKEDILLIVFIRLFLVKHGKDLFKVAIRWCHKIHEYLFKQIFESTNLCCRKYTMATCSNLC